MHAYTRARWVPQSGLYLKHSTVSYNRKKIWCFDRMLCVYLTVTPVGYLRLSGGNITKASHCVLAVLVLSNTRSNSNHHFFFTAGFLGNEHESLCVVAAVRRAISEIPAVPRVRTNQVRITWWLMCVLVLWAVSTPHYLSGYPFSPFRVCH